MWVLIVSMLVLFPTGEVAPKTYQYTEVIKTEAECWDIANKIGDTVTANRASLEGAKVIGYGFICKTEVGI